MEREAWKCWHPIQRLFFGCPCQPFRDADGCGGECIECGKVFGYVTNVQLRAIADSAVRGAETRLTQPPPQ